MRKIILLPVLVLAVLLCVPAVTGVLIRSSDAEALLAPLERQTQLLFTKQSQQAGWFRSEMQFSISHPQWQQVFPESSHYQLTLHIWHGPLFFTPRGLQAGLAYAQLEPLLSGPVASAIASMPQSDQLDELDIAVLAGFGGDWQINAAADEMLFDTGTETLQIRGLDARLDFVINQDENTVDMQQSLAIAEIASASPVSAVNWQMQIEGMNNELISLYSGLIANDPSSPLSQTLLNGVADRGALLLLQSPLDYSVQFDIAAYGGNHRGNLAILWPGLPQLASLDDFHLGNAVRALQVSLQLHSDEAALLRSPLAEALPVYQAQGFVEISNNEVSVIATLEAGTLTVNQQVFPLDPFLGL